MNSTVFFEDIYTNSTYATNVVVDTGSVVTSNKAPHIPATTTFRILNGTMTLINGSVSHPEPAKTEVIVMLSLLFIIIGLIGILGNSLVIVVILLDKKMRNSVTNIFIMNLAVADLLIMLFGVPEIVQFMLNRGWLIGEAFCKINRFTLVVSLYVSILSLVTVCIERWVCFIVTLFWENVRLVPVPSY